MEYLSILFLVYMIGVGTMFAVTLVSLGAPFRIVASDFVLSFFMALTWPVSWLILYKSFRNS